MLLIVEVRTRNTAVAIQRAGKGALPVDTYWNRSDDFAALHPAPTSAQDRLDPQQLALVLIFS